MNEVNAQMADRAAGASDPYRRAGRSCTGSTGFHITVFEPSYQERNGCSGQEHGWLWATAESASKSSRSVAVNASIDQAALSFPEVCGGPVTRRCHSAASPALFLPIANGLQ
jgi:hypothetical protein